MNPNLITLDRLVQMLLDAGLSDEQLFAIRGVKPNCEINGMQHWDSADVEAAINAAKGETNGSH